MPIFLNAQGKFEYDDARDAMRAYGVKDKALINAIYSLDNSEPESIGLDFLPGEEIKNCIGAVYALALASGQTVTANANGLSFTAAPLPWIKGAARKVAELNAGAREA